MQNLHVSLSTYLTDRGHWPQIPTTLADDLSGYETWWITELEPYGSKKKSWLCPVLSKSRIQFDGYPLRIHDIPGGARRPRQRDLTGPPRIEYPNFQRTGRAEQTTRNLLPAQSLPLQGWLLPQEGRSLGKQRNRNSDSGVFPFPAVQPRRLFESLAIALHPLQRRKRPASFLAPPRNTTRSVCSPVYPFLSAESAVKSS